MELLRATTVQHPAPVAADDAGQADDIEGEGRGDSVEAGSSPKRTRRPKAAASGKTKARNLRLNDDVHDRLWLLARQRKQTVSAVANDLLDKALPRWELKRQG
jgi:hypothetical protein